MDSAAVLAVGVALTFGVWWWLSSPDPAPADPPAPPIPVLQSSVPDDHVVVHVSGAVESPGVVRLTAGARAIDAIEAAGGALADADLSRINLAAEVVDGSQIRVPTVDESPSTETSDPGPVVINQADAAALETLPGVGPVLAERIVAHRETHGAFETVEDLLDVSGIGESILARLRPHIRIP